VTVAQTRNLDDLELELRKLPGVRAAGFTERDDLLVVQVQVAGNSPSPSLSQQAARIAYRHADKPIALEVVRWRTVEVPAGPPAVTESTPVPSAPTPPAVTEDAAAPHPPRGDRVARVRLLAVLTFPDTDELEVHLTYEGRRVIGRSAASTGVSGAVGATLEGLRNFAPDLGADLLWAEELAGHEAAHASVVACALQAGGAAVLGIAAGGSRIEAAARSALHALNRTLEDRLSPPA
jgi:hypothetical protein